MKYVVLIPFPNSQVFAPQSEGELLWARHDLEVSVQRPHAGEGQLRLHPRPEGVEHVVFPERRGARRHRQDGRQRGLVEGHQGEQDRLHTSRLCHPPLIIMPILKDLIQSFFLQNLHETY